MGFLVTEMALLESHFNIKYNCLLTSIFSVFLVGVHITNRFRQTQLLMWMSVGFDQVGVEGAVPAR